MPIYEYQCNACDHQLEVMQKMADQPLTECPECGEATLSKMISAVGFRLSGSGWYETDFKSGKKKNLKENAESKPKSDAAKKAPKGNASTSKVSSSGAS